MAADGQGTKWRRNIAENFNQLSRVHERCKQTNRRAAENGYFGDVFPSQSLEKLNLTQKAHIHK